MFWEITCRFCGKGLKAREEHLGRRVRCPYCRKEFVCNLPEAQPGAASGAPTALPVSTYTLPGPSAERLGPAPPLPLPEASSRTAASRMLKPPGTNVSLILTGAAAIGVTVVFYVCIVWPLDHTWFGQLLAHRSWVQHTIMFLSFWASAILVLKSRKLSHQKQSVLFDMLPTEIAYEIRPDNVDAFRTHITNLPCDPRDSYLMTRCLRALDHFKSRGAVQEVSELLGAQGEIDMAAVDSSFAMVRIFVWAIPILGFIGTVLGIGVAVGGFSDSLTTLGKTTDLGVLQTSLRDVTAGLAVAFDTTFLALVMSMIVMFPMSSLHKAEHDMLISVAEYCNENLLRRLYEPRHEAADPTRIREAVATAMGAHEADLRLLATHLETAGENLTQKVVAGWDAIHDRMQAAYGKQFGDMQAAYGKQFGDLQAVLGKFAEERREFIAQVRGAEEANLRHLADNTSTVSEAAGHLLNQIASWQQTQLKDFRAAIQSLKERLDVLQQDHARHDLVAEALSRALTEFADSLRGLRQELAVRPKLKAAVRSESDVLRHVGTAQGQVSQAVEALHRGDGALPQPPRRGWFRRLFGGKT